MVAGKGDRMEVVVARKVDSTGVVSECLLLIALSSFLCCLFIRALCCVCAFVRAMSVGSVCVCGEEWGERV